MAKRDDELVTLTQYAANVSAKLVAMSNDPKAMLMPSVFRSMLTDLAQLLPYMAKRIEQLEDKR